MNWLRHLIWKDVTQNPQYDEVQVPCPEITIEGIDQALHAKLLAEGTAAGAKFDGATATIEGCYFDWNYDAEAQTLHVTCTKKPFYVSCTAIQSKITEIVTKAKEGI